MLSKARIKLIRSLQIKKYRQQEQLFIVEGAKSVAELLKSDFVVELIAGTEEYLSTIDYLECVFLGHRLRNSRRLVQSVAP